MLIELLQRDIEGRPEQQRIVSALLLGASVSVPEGKDVGGTFKSMPVCRSAIQTGCVLAFATFRANAPPPSNARFGRSNTPGQDFVCVDPVVLSGIPVTSMLTSHGDLLGRTDARMPGWNAMTASVNTPFLDVPGLLKLGCVRQGLTSYLSLSIDEGAAGTRPIEMPGDIVFGASGRVLDDWGLHLIDMNVAMGNLMEVVRRQGQAFIAR